MSNYSKVIVVFGFILFSVYNIAGVVTSEVDHDSIEESRLKLKSKRFELSNDPWLNPEEGILATRETKVFTLARDDNKRLQFTEVENIVNYIVDHSDDLRFATLKNIHQNNNRKEKYRFSTKKSSKSNENLSDHLNVVYPELAVAVAYDFLQLFNFDYWKIIPYLLSFWNAVDMRYRGFENPKYRFFISQIILEIEPGSFEFLSTHVNHSDFLTTTSINEARRFWYAQKNLISLDSYDLIIIMTSRIICSRFNEENECKRKIYGQTWPSGACTINHETQQTQNMAIMHDNGAYQGVTTAAHEIGHLLGANDDGISFFNSTTQDWGPANCNVWDGYIMSGGIQATPNSFNWSNCTLEKFEKFIYSDKAKCVYNKPKNYNNPIPRYLPGKLMNADEQCRRAGGIESCESEILNCIMLQCLFSNGECRNSTAPAVEGTTCGYNTVGQICIHGKCVFEIDLV